MPFFANCLHMNPPIQLAVQLHTEVCVAGHNFHFSILDADWCRRRLDPPPKVHHHLLGLCGVKIKMFFVNPVHKVPDYTPVLFVLASFNKISDYCVIRTFLEEDPLVLCLKSAV